MSEYSGLSERNTPCLTWTIGNFDLSFQGDIGLNVAQMIVELIRDNRKIVDRITPDQIEMFVGLLRENKVRKHAGYISHNSS